MRSKRTVGCALALWIMFTASIMLTANLGILAQERKEAAEAGAPREQSEKAPTPKALSDSPLPPASEEISRETEEAAKPARARVRPSERIPLDSAVAFPVDI